MNNINAIAFLYQRERDMPNLETKHCNQDFSTILQPKILKVSKILIGCK